MTSGTIDTLANMFKIRNKIPSGRRTAGLNGRLITPSSRAFAVKLASLIRETGLTSAQLARVLGYADGSTIGHILASRIAFPVRRAEAFADALGLEGVERESFIDDADLSILPPRSQALVARLRAAAPLPTTRGADGGGHDTTQSSAQISQGINPNEETSS